MVDTTPLVDSGKEEKVGHKYCGTLTLLYSLFSLAYIMLYTNSAQQLLDDIDLIFASTFIGCCCDSRRAVLIFNIFNLIFGIIILLFWVGFRASLGAFYFFYIVGIIIISLVIAGAALYNKWMVILGALWAVISLIIAIVLAVQGKGIALTVNGVVYHSPIVELIWAIIWQGLVLYVSCSFEISVAYTCDSLYSYHAFVSNFVQLQPNYNLQ
jgi:hypothetical protein